ncbi:cell division protein FtsL [candidate division KSB1 bacterium]|nr:cell division protein FtsL [candidate division KSB1 bacterium]
MNKRIVSASKPPRKKPQSMVAPRRSGKSGTAEKNSGRQLKPRLDLAAIRKSIALLLPFAILLSLALLLIWERVRVNELAAEIAALEAQRNQLADQNGKLLIQVEQLAGFGRISKLASQRLGLVTVPHQVIVVEEE